MSIEGFDLTKKLGPKRLAQFAEHIIAMGDAAGFKISSRGWAYQLEGARLINKDQFDKVEAAINRCRKRGLLPIDFVAEEASRKFDVVESPSEHEGKDMDDIVSWMLRDVLDGSQFYTPNWWDGEDYYIQVVVEKIDLKTLFTPVCERFHSPIATSKGWASMLQRAEYARRFSEAEARGLKCVLLYCGDHDPDGLRISEFLRSNLADLADVTWEDGWPGYDPTDLIIDRFGLNRELIDKHNLTWIDNLITGSGKNLASRGHKNFAMSYVQDYLKSVGERKCEANAIIPFPEVARKLIEDAFTKYVGPKAEERFRKKREAATKDYARVLGSTGIDLKQVRKGITKLEK